MGKITMVLCTAVAVAATVTSVTGQEAGATTPAGTVAAMQRLLDNQRLLEERQRHLEERVVALEEIGFGEPVEGWETGVWHLANTDGFLWVWVVGAANYTALVEVQDEGDWRCSSGRYRSDRGTSEPMGGLCLVRAGERWRIRSRGDVYSKWWPIHRVGRLEQSP